MDASQYCVDYFDVQDGEFLFLGVDRVEGEDCEDCEGVLLERAKAIRMALEILEMLNYEEE